MGNEPMNALSMWVIYDHPKDHPHCFVVREHTITAGGKLVVSIFHTEFDSLEDARDEIRQGRICIPRNPHDALVIVECWV